MLSVAIGCDHRGIGLKQYVIRLLDASGCSYRDFGAYTTDSVDYPGIAAPVAEAVARGDFERGILICDTGIGMSIAANKVKGVRAALCRDAFDASRARQHNDANVLCLAAARGEDGVNDIVDAFLNCEFEGGRHLHRLNQISALEC